MPCWPLHRCKRLGKHTRSNALDVLTVCFSQQHVVSRDAVAEQRLFWGRACCFSFSVTAWELSVHHSDLFYKTQTARMQWSLQWPDLRMSKLVSTSKIQISNTTLVAVKRLTCGIICDYFPHSQKFELVTTAGRRQPQPALDIPWMSEKWGRHDQQSTRTKDLTKSEGNEKHRADLSLWALPEKTTEWVAKTCLGL